MVIPPILEVYVLWHPGDARGEVIADELLSHFRGTTYSGLLGGAVEVYLRSAAWENTDGPPRPMPFMQPLPHGLAPPGIAAVVAVLGTHLARAVEERSDWRDYLSQMSAAAAASGSVGVYTLRLDPAATDGTTLASMFSGQGLADESATDGSVLARELAQSIARLVGDPSGDRLQVFISHTKRHSPDEEPDDVDELVAQVRAVIGSTHMAAFFDEADIQPGEDWYAKLEVEAARSALLMVRTDRYAGREWCQREVIIAKRSEMPVVALSALKSGEERGSFVMDHMPAIPLDRADDDTSRLSIEVALNQLADEALKRALWKRQRQHLADAGFDWLPVHAPEPVTLMPWLLARVAAGVLDDHVLVMHPDPPLGPEEVRVIEEILSLAGMGSNVDVLTPRTFASRGGEVDHA